MAGSLPQLRKASLHTLKAADWLILIFALTDPVKIHFICYQKLLPEG